MQQYRLAEESRCFFQSYQLKCNLLLASYTGNDFIMDKKNVELVSEVAAGLIINELYDKLSTVRAR